MRRKIGEHPEYLTGVAPERLDEKPIGHSTVPLGAVLPECIPHERITDRCIRDLEIPNHSQVARGYAIEDHAECVEPTRSPRRRRGQAVVHEVAELVDPFATARLLLGGF